MLTATTMFAPLVLAFLGFGIEWGDVNDRAFETFVYWSWLLTPYQTQPPVVPSAVGAILVAAHWLIVATANAVVGRHLRFVWALAVSAVSVIGTGGMALLALWRLGFVRVFEGL